MDNKRQNNKKWIEFLVVSLISALILIRATFLWIASAPNENINAYFVFVIGTLTPLATSVILVAFSLKIFAEKEANFRTKSIAVAFAITAILLFAVSLLEPSYIENMIR